MSETERAKALKAIQLELFQIRQDYVRRRRELKRQLILVCRTGLKRCRKCRHEMDVEQFYRDERYSDGYYPYCRECQIAKVTKPVGVRKVNGTRVFVPRAA